MRQYGPFHGSHLKVPPFTWEPYVYAGFRECRAEGGEASYRQSRVADALHEPAGALGIDFSACRG